MPSRRAVLGACAGFGTVALAGCLGDDEPAFDHELPGSGSWPFPDYCQRNTRWNRHASPPESEPERRWEWNTFEDPPGPPSGGAIASLVVADGAVVAAGNELVALDAETGEERWRVEFQAYELAIGDGLVYAMGRSDVAAHELETGEERWYAGYDDGILGFFGEDPERAIHLTASEREVYVGRASPTEHAVTALDADDGSTRWELAQPEPDDDNPYTDGSVYAPENTFLGLEDDGLVAGGTGWAGAFGPDTEGVGERWLDRERMSCARPVVGEGLVVLPEFDVVGANEDDEPEEHALTAFDTEEGGVEWEVTSGEPFGDVVFADGTLYIYVARDDEEQTEEVGGELLAIDPDGGSVDTLAETPWDGRAVTAGGDSLVLSGGRVGPRHRAIGAYGLDGEERWVTEVEANGFRPNPREVVLVGDRVYVGTGNGDVLAYG